MTEEHQIVEEPQTVDISSPRDRNDSANIQANILDRLHDIASSWKVNADKEEGEHSDSAEEVKVTEESRSRRHRDGRRSREKDSRRRRSRDRRSRDRDGRRRRRSRSRESRRDHKERSSERSRDPEREKEREQVKEKEKERKKKGLPPLKKEHLGICSTTLWVGHLSKVTMAV